jgi:hypothetical protein
MILSILSLTLTITLALALTLTLSLTQAPTQTCPQPKTQAGVVTSVVRCVIVYQSDQRRCLTGTCETKAKIEVKTSKSNIAINAWLPQASYPCGNFSEF